MAELFPGIEPLLNQLKKSGYKLAIATHMAEEYAIKTLKRESVFDYFDVIHGASFEIEYSKRDLIEQCLQSLDISSEDSVMIGDGIDDHLSAKSLGIEFIAAEYGYEIDTDYCSLNGIQYISRPEELLHML
jgi:phosphoglycolate phosphatase